ncbi:MAG: hypothetical protein JO117_05300, partial [Verrucomicrobia bacterium]|nr:hypothetical protein [Verrucomicrobiota bacterium]
HPSLTFLRELYNKCGSGKQEGNYYEIGLSPSTTAGPVTITLPITAGFGSSRFYANNRGFGYFTPGIQLGVPLKFIPSSYGTWNFTTFYKFYYLGNSLSNFNTGNPTPGFGDNSVRERGHDEHVLSAALVMTFP